MRQREINLILNFVDREGITLNEYEGNAMVWLAGDVYNARLFPTGKILQASNAPDIIVQIIRNQRMRIDGDTQALIDKMLEDKIKKDAAVTHTQEDLEKEAKFLLGWAKRSALNRVGPGSVLYRRGTSRNCTKIYPRMVSDLLLQGLAIGNVQTFVMVASRVKELK